MSTGTCAWSAPNIGPIHENHQLRQFFYNQDTIDRLAQVLGGFENPCCLCVPMLAWEMAKRGRTVRALDIDTRFKFLPGYLEYNLYRPAYLQEEFDLIIVDPPFHAVGLGQLFKALKVLSHFNFDQKIMMSHLKRRQWDVEAVFAPFGLQVTEEGPTYLTAKKCSSREGRVLFYSNI